ILLLFGSGCASAFNNQDHPPRPTIGNERPNLDFSNYRTPLFFGPIANLKGYTQDNSGIWRDEIGKRVSKPSINYAGKYFISLHSCGGSCRYYTMSDMSNGKDLDILDRFSST